MEHITITLDEIYEKKKKSKKQNDIFNRTEQRDHFTVEKKNS